MIYDTLAFHPIVLELATGKKSVCLIFDSAMLLAGFEQFSEYEVGVKTKSDHDRKAAFA